jgi:hypothetical protein
MDYLHAAFGSFQPQADADAAMKFALNAALMDGRLDDLAAVLTPGHRTGGIAGEPGWQIDRLGSATQPRYRAQVDRDGYALAHPEGEYDAAGLLRVLGPMLAAYARHRPAAAPAVGRILELAAPR